jgi:acyl-CoA dehydrogenase
MLAPQPYESPWMTDDVKPVAELARVFFANEVVPHLERFGENHQVDRDLWNKAGEAGLLCITIPEEFGGGGGDFAQEAAVIWEQGMSTDDSFGYVVHSTIVAPYIYKYGTQEQKQKWLPKLATGELVGAIAMTEPGAGSDLQGIRTTAKRDGDYYVINGSKTFITNGSHANLIIVVTRTGGEGAKGISLIIIETEGLAGFERGRVLQKIGQHGQDTRELFFADMKVPTENLLGTEEGQGFIQLMEELPQERLGIAISAVSSAQAATQLTIEYAKQREAFGKPILNFQNTGFVLAEVTTEVMAARAFLDYCIGLHSQGKLDATTASRAKYFCTDMQVSVINRCVQVFGGYGYMAEYPIARMYAGARVQPIYGGTNEVMKVLISRAL